MGLVLMPEFNAADEVPMQYTYKVTRTYLVQSDVPLAGESLCDITDDQTEAIIILWMRIVYEQRSNQTHAVVNVALANIKSEQTDNADWALF